MLLERMDQRLGTLEDGQAELKTGVAGLKTDVAGFKAGVSALEADVSVLKEDVSGLKEDVSVLKEDVSGLKTDVSGLKVRLDVDITRQLKLLEEGHTTLPDTLSPRDRVEALEDEVTFLKSVVKSMAQRLSALEKAQ